MKSILTALICFTALGCSAALLGIIDTEVTGWMVPMPGGSLKYVSIKEFNSIKDLWQPREIIVDFYCYTSATDSTGTKITINNTQELSACNFNSDNPTRIIIHGWLNNNETKMNTELRKAFLETGVYNVIVVDWGRVAGNLNYVEPRLSVPLVGAEVADLIDFLHREGNMNFNDLLVVGHSLGAHVAGFAGKEVKEVKIHTIIGLDPALPLFYTFTCDEGLCSDDAEYVESIHTDAGFWGQVKPIGHTSFYPYGGRSQPGCLLNIINVCSHDFAFVYYAEALRYNNFESNVCNDLESAWRRLCIPKRAGLRMGDPVNFGQTGIFYVPVKRNSPYGNGAIA